MRFSEMPGWTRQLMSGREFRKAIIRAAKMECMEIAARWDRGNGWNIWGRGPQQVLAAFNEWNALTGISAGDRIWANPSACTKAG